MTIIFESYIYPETLAELYKSNSKCLLDYAAHNLCKAIYMGLKDNEVQVRIVNVPNIGSYPTYYKYPFVKGANIEDGNSLSFYNVTLIKRYDIRRRLYKGIVKELKCIPQTEEITLLLYNYRCLSFISKLKKKWPKLKVVMLVTDLPGFMIMAPSKLMQLGKVVFGAKEEVKKEHLEYVDGFVLLAPMMKEALGVGKKPWVQVEGIFNTDTAVEEQKKDTSKVVLYTGNLGLRYGIGTLLEAFCGIPDKDYRLWICGDGDGLEEVKKYAAKDSRIEFKGILPRQEVLKLQKQATILINPRNSKDEYTKYSFPSKTMEYLASGTPVVMSHLASIPSEYDSHIFYFEDESIEGMRKTIIEICNKPSDELMAFGEKASEFINANKTPQPQIAKVLDFIKSI